MLTIDPPPAASRCGIAYLQPRNGPRRLTEMIASNSSRLASATVFGMDTPALLTMPSRFPCSLAVSSMSALNCSASLTSNTAAVTLSVSRARASEASSRSAATTIAPGPERVSRQSRPRSSRLRRSRSRPCRLSQACLYLRRLEGFGSGLLLERGSGEHHECSEDDDPGHEEHADELDRTPEHARQQEDRELEQQPDDRCDGHRDLPTAEAKHTRDIVEA